MNRKIIGSLAVFVTGLLIAAIWFNRLPFTHGQESGPATAPSSDEEKGNTVAPVKTATVRSDEITQTITAYGSIAPDPGATEIYSVPADVRVVKVYVVGGQSVSKDTPLVDVEASADTRLASVDARNALDSAKKNLADTQQRFNLKLATNTDLLAAQQAVQSAQAKLDNLQKRGIGQGVQTIKSTADSFVTKVDVQQGQVVTASGPLVELLPKGRIEACLGIEPDDAVQLKPSQPVQLYLSTASTQPVAAKIHMMSERLNPQTHLIDAFIAADAQTPMLLDNFVRGDLAVRSEKGLVVPRDAVIPADQGFTLLTVKDGHAVKHAVTLGLEDDQNVIVHSDEVHAGDTVIVQGNLELDDGAAVAPAATTEEAK